MTGRYRKVGWRVPHHLALEIWHQRVYVLGRAFFIFPKAILAQAVLAQGHSGLLLPRMTPGPVLLGLRGATRPAACDGATVTFPLAATAKPAMTPPWSPAMPFIIAPPPDRAPPPTLSLPTTGGAGWWLSRWTQAAAHAKARGTPPVAAAYDRWRTSTDGPPSSASPPCSAPSRRRSSTPFSPPSTPSMGPRPRFTIWWRKPATPIPLPPADSPQHGGVAVSRAETCAG